jgi:hypothetical protein
MAWQWKISGGFLAVVGYMLSPLPSPAQRQVQAGAPESNFLSAKVKSGCSEGESPSGLAESRRNLERKN